jgi:signal peptide peptidase SppA
MDYQKTTEETGLEGASLYCERKTGRLKRFFSKHNILVFVAISVLVLDILFVIDIIVLIFSPLSIGSNNPNATAFSTTATSTVEENTSSEDSSTCNVQGINLHGSLVTYIPNTDYNSMGDLTEDETASESIYFAVKEAEKKESVKAIIVEIDSPGGDPVAAEEVERVLKSSSKPVIAYIRSIGASAAYWSATGASRIFALPNSQVGGIAVNSSYLDNVNSNQKNGYTFHDLSTGKFKNITNEDKLLTAEEKALIMKDLYITHDFFVKTVAENRKLDVNKVKEIANGWAYTGTESLQFGLVDEMGGLNEVKDYLKKNFLNNEDVDICW